MYIEEPQEWHWKDLGEKNHYILKTLLISSWVFFSFNILMIILMIKCQLQSESTNFLLNHKIITQQSLMFIFNFLMLMLSGFFCS